MPNTTMNKLSRLKDDLHLSPLKYKESLSSVTFYGKVNIRRKLRPKSSKFSSFVDFDHDFQVKIFHNQLISIMIILMSNFDFRLKILLMGLGFQTN
jgi:hypothetical protein